MDISSILRLIYKMKFSDQSNVPFPREKNHCGHSGPALRATAYAKSPARTRFPLESEQFKLLINNDLYIYDGELFTLNRLIVVTLKSRLNIKIGVTGICIF